MVHGDVSWMPVCFFVVVVPGILASKESANSPRRLLGFIKGGLSPCSQAGDSGDLPTISSVCVRVCPFWARVYPLKRSASFYSGALAASLVWQIILGLSLVCPGPAPPVQFVLVLRPLTLEFCPASVRIQERDTRLFHSLLRATWTHVSLSGTHISLFSLLRMTVFLRMKESP